MRGSESRLRHVLSELGQWVSPPPRVAHLLRRTHREALALSGSANGVTVDPATACMWPVRLPCARLPRLSVWLPLCSLKARVVRGPLYRLRSALSRGRRSHGEPKKRKKQKHQYRYVQNSR